MTIRGSTQRLRRHLRPHDRRTLHQHRARRPGSLIYDALGGRVETIFDDSIVAIDERAGQLHVGFERGAPRAFDLVIGADGLHSQVRRLAVGRELRDELELPQY